MTNFFEAPLYNFQNSLGSLRQISEQSPSGVLHKEQPVGLAVGQMNMGLVMQTNMVVANDGQVCARPKNLRIDVGFQHNMVYVASELPRNSCAHGEVLKHEDGHVAIDRQLLDDYKPLLQKFAETAVQRLGTVRAATPDEAERKMQMFINEQLQIAADQMNQERSHRQASHDSVAEYTRIGLVCNGAIAQAVSDYTTKTQTASQTINTTNAATTRLPAAPRSSTRQPFTRY